MAAKALELRQKLVGFCNGVVAPRPARDTASVVDGNEVQGKPKTPFERMKDFSNTCAVGKIVGTTYGELSAVPKSLVGEKTDDTKHEVRRVHTPMQNIFLELTVQCRMWRYCFLRNQ